MGFNMEDPHPCVLPSDRVGDYPRAITESTNLDPSFYFCIIPRNTADYYMAIKKATLLDLGIPSQVLVQRTMGKNKMSVATKIGIQMNAKMRGAPWLMKIPFSDLMIIGYDVSHDTKDKKKSYGALVASLDSRGSKYFSAVSSHKSGNELSDNLKINFIKALRAFQKENKKFPERIIFYRDGVGDGQIEYVLQHEIGYYLSQKHNFSYFPDFIKKKFKISAQIEQQFRQYYELDKFPQFAFIIVNKRINTRLFTMNKCNPNAGTIVDDVITMPERYDFYLISTSEKQSTVSPTYYNVAKSNLQTPPSRIQELTFRLCHLYYNWNGNILLLKNSFCIF
jgi:aubergine-like protein